MAISWLVVFAKELHANERHRRNNPANVAYRWNRGQRKRAANTIGDEMYIMPFDGVISGLVKM